MAVIWSPKRHYGPKVKPIAKRQLSKKDQKPIVYPERTDSQNQRLRVLTFLENHRIPLSNPEELQKPTQQEASDFYQIPHRTISDWVQKKAEIERVGRGSQKVKEEWDGYTRRVLWPELEDQLYGDFIERGKAGRIVWLRWFRIQSQFRFHEIYPDVDPQIFSFSNGWFYGFLGCHKISLRTITKKATKLPADYEILVVNWLQFNQQNSQPRRAHFWEVAIKHPVCRYALSNICNLDETPTHSSTWMGRPMIPLEARGYGPRNPGQGGTNTRQHLFCAYLPMAFHKFPQ